MHSTLFHQFLGMQQQLLKRVHDPHWQLAKQFILACLEEEVPRYRVLIHRL